MDFGYGGGERRYRTKTLPVELSARQRSDRRRRLHRRFATDTRRDDDILNAARGGIRGPSFLDGLSRRCSGLRQGRRGRRQQCRQTHGRTQRSEEHTSELQSLMRISYAVFCLKKKTKKNEQTK